jgi:hypothetical protein
MEMWACVGCFIQVSLFQPDTLIDDVYNAEFDVGNLFINKLMFYLTKDSS